MNRLFLIGIAGRAGSGKDTVGGILKRLFNGRGEGMKLLAFAEPLKKICQEIYAFTDEQMTVHTAKVAPDRRYPREDGSFLTPREAMQLLGTQWARRCYPKTWADFGLRRAKLLTSSNLHVVFTDVRFVNEAEAIRDAGGQVWRVRRPTVDVPNPKWWQFWEKRLHASETEMDSEEFEALVTHRILNDGTLEQLHERVKDLVL